LIVPFGLYPTDLEEFLCIWRAVRYISWKKKKENRLNISLLKMLYGHKAFQALHIPGTLSQKPSSQGILALFDGGNPEEIKGRFNQQKIFYDIEDLHG